MKAYRLTAPKTAELVDVDVPRPAPGEVLLKVTGAGLCHSDLHILDTPQWQPLPMTLGHEVCGQVVETGGGVPGWEVGESALVYLAWGCGTCRSCADGRENACMRYPRTTVPGPGLGYDGGIAEYLTVHPRFLVGLGDLDPVDAAPLTDAGLTPYHAIRQAADLLFPSATAVVIGIGGLGHMAVQILTATTAVRVIAVDTDESKLDHARTLGAAETVLSDSGAAEVIKDLTSGQGPEVVFDFVGAEPTLRLAADTIASYGRIVTVGLAGGTLGFPADSPPVGLPWGASVIKPYGGTRADLHDVVALARAGKISVTVERHPMSAVADAYRRLASGEVTGRAVVMP